MRLSDFKGVFKKQKLEFISAENVSADFWVVKLKPKETLTWIPGEHAIFTLPGKEIDGKKWRAFSLASVPEEGVVMIGTKAGQQTSSFKKNLFGMKPGEIVEMRGPFGWYKIPENGSQIVMIATGVGISPDRALLLELRKYPEKTVELIHSDKNHLFRDELESIAESNKNFKLHFTNNRQETEIAISRISTKYKNNAVYFVSGSFKIILSVRKKLRKAGIKTRRIVNDPFLGY